MTVNNNETVPHAFRALATGYGLLGPLDYAGFPASSVPELSLSGDKPFTLFTTLCFRNVQGGAILEQQDLFSIGMMNGLLYVGGVDWCAVKFSEAAVAKFATDRWYTLSLVFDGESLAVYLGAEKKAVHRCKIKKTGVSRADRIIGKGLDAWFRTFRLFDKALSESGIRQLVSGSGITPEDSIVWFDFDLTGKKNRSPKPVQLSTKAFCRMVMVTPVRQFRFSVGQKYANIEALICNQLSDQSESVSFTGCMGKKENENGQDRLTGMVSFGTSQPVMCELEGEIVTLWESTDFPQTDK